MGNIYFECNKCGDALAATSDMANSMTDCPKCGESVQVPKKSTVAPPPGGVKMGGALAENKRAVVMLAVLFIILFVYVGKMLNKDEPEPEPQKPVVEEPVVTNAPPVEEVEPEEPPEPIVSRGDTKESVLEALGKPKKTSKFGNTEIMVYDEFELELTDGRVTGKKQK